MLVAGWAYWVATAVKFLNIQAQLRHYFVQ